MKTTSLYLFAAFSLKLDELTEAEDALSEANALNNCNAEVWAYLALVCLKVSRIIAFTQSPVRGQRFGTKSARDRWLLTHDSCSLMSSEFRCYTQRKGQIWASSTWNTDKNYIKMYFLERKF